MARRRQPYAYWRPTVFEVVLVLGAVALVVTLGRPGAMSTAAPPTSSYDAAPHAPAQG